MRMVSMIPLTVAALLALPLARPALAASSVGEALSLLAQMKKTADKCGFLNVGQRDEMGAFLARAEVITARRAGAAVARRAVMRGKAAGAKAACTEDQAALVREAYAAAREALHANAAPEPRRQEAAERTPRDTRPPTRRNAKATAHRNARLAVQRKPKKAARAVASDAKRTTRRAKSGAVAGYVALTSQYYLALRCRSVSHARMQAMYREVKARHYALIRSHGGKVTARAKARARAIGSRGGCRTAGQMRERRAQLNDARRAM